MPIAMPPVILMHSLVSDYIVLFIQIFLIKSYECETIFHNKRSLKNKELHTLSHEILFSQYV